MIIPFENNYKKSIIFPNFDIKSYFEKSGIGRYNFPTRKYPDISGILKRKRKNPEINFKLNYKFFICFLNPKFYFHYYSKLINIVSNSSLFFPQPTL